VEKTSDGDFWSGVAMDQGSQMEQCTGGGDREKMLKLIPKRSFKVYRICKSFKMNCKRHSSHAEGMFVYLQKMNLIYARYLSVDIYSLFFLPPYT